MGLLDLIEKAINEHGSAAVQKERLVLIREQFEQLQKEHDRLEAENKELKGKIYDLTEELKKVSIPDNFFEYRGILARRDADGNIEPDAYCPDCKKPMMSLEGVLPFKCTKCEFVAGLNRQDLLAAFPKSSS